MDKSNIKKDNRQALPKFLLVLAASAVAGGMLGFVTVSLGQHTSVAETITAALDRAMPVVGLWGIPIATTVLLLASVGLFRQAKRLYACGDSEDDTFLEQADNKLNWAMLWTSTLLILDLFLFSAMNGIGRVPMGETASLPLGLLFFILSVALCVVIQQKIVDLTRRMNPEKRGSVYDPNFKKEWLESCDEAERKQIGQAAYKAYSVLNTLCPLLWVALMLLNFIFDLGLMPSFIVLLIWAVQNTAYCLECIRLSGKASL